jgi:hypothetical protein
LQLKAITAGYDFQDVWYDMDGVKCQEIEPPWRVDTSTCYRISLLRLNASDPVSPMNDVGLVGTADSAWGAQCGSAERMEVMTGVKLHNAGTLFLDSIQCCSLVF